MIEIKASKWIWENQAQIRGYKLMVVLWELGWETHKSKFREEAQRGSKVVKKKNSSRLEEKIGDILIHRIRLDSFGNF